MVKIIAEQENGYKFVITSKSGTEIFISKNFPSKADAKMMVKKLGNEMVVERRTDYQGKFLVDFFTKGGVHVGSSKTYTSEAGMENGIKNVRRLLATQEFF